MSNFDYLKNFNEELYEIGVKLEEDTIESPRAVTADATIFLETLVKDIYRQTKNKLENNQISFYKKIDNLYRLGAITYIYKNKLQDAYNLRNKIHKNTLDIQQEKKLALNIHQRLYYISKKYFQDYCENERYVTIPEYTTPTKNVVQFKNCIICGNTNDSLSNMCKDCNEKIENANLLLNIKNTLNKNFTRKNLIKLGISESESISLLMKLSKDRIVIKKGDYYSFNEDKFEKYIDEINQYIEINRLITKFYKNEITPNQIKNTMEYWKGSINQKPFVEFYNLITIKIEKNFEENLVKYENIKKSMKLSYMDQFNVKQWFKREKRLFIKGNLNDAFILYNELLIKEFFELKRKGLDDSEIFAKEVVSLEMYEFWKNEFMRKDFFKKTSDIKKDIIIKELKKNRYLNQALKIAGVSRKEFEKIYVLSKKANDSFYNEFKKEYTLKRQKLILKNLKFNSLKKTLRMCKITKNEFIKWYFKSEKELSEFYLKSSKLLMDQYLHLRRNGYNKRDILKNMHISKDIFNSWSQHENLDIFKEFKHENKEITSHLVKRGLIINGLKEDKTKDEAILSAGLTPHEFLIIYNVSKRENTNFHKRFDQEYVNNRQRLFTKLIKDTDFYNAIDKSEISQIEFNRWYLKDQDKFISSNNPTDFYLKTTHELMDKYLKSRWEGKNKPDAARSIGLSNPIIDKWLKHTEFDLFYDFKKKYKQLTIDLIIKGFYEKKSKVEVSDEYDIPLKTINEYIELGRVGYIKYERIYELFDEYIVPNQFEVFLEDFKNKPFNKSLKHSKFTKEELEFYYNLGKSGDEKFKKYYEKLLDLKIELYVNTILSKKSEKIALKNSTLNKDELKENKSEIEKRILDGRINIISDVLLKHKPTGVKAANAAGITLEEIYDWYMKGKEGDVEFKEFFIMFEISLVFPRVLAYNKALSMGLPKNWLHKQLKKDLGEMEFKIWLDNNLLNQCDIRHIKIDGNQIVKDKLMSVLKNAKSVDKFRNNENHDTYEFLKKAFYGNQKFSKSLIDVSSDEKIEAAKKEIMGN